MDRAAAMNPTPVKYAENNDGPGIYWGMRTAMNLEYWKC
jgi:hypothetical protein